MSEDKILDALCGEYMRYQRLVELALDQVSDDLLFQRPGAGENSIAVLLVHLGGNLQSRFTDFLTSDGEKSWRNRDGEFVCDVKSRAEVLEVWNAGLEALEAALRELRDDQLGNEVLIRGQSLSVMAALARSLAHFSYHVGQIISLARHGLGASWQVLSIPVGGSRAYDADPTHEQGPR